MLEETAFQIEVIANLHKLLSSQADGRRVDLDRYLRSVCAAAAPTLSALGRLSPEFRLGSGRSVAPDFAVSIALAIAELVTNAMKHAHPEGADGGVTVIVMTRGDRLVIEVVDDGVGLPEGYEPVSARSFGLRLVQQTAERWGGTVAFEPAEPGLCVRMTLPEDAGRVT